MGITWEAVTVWVASHRACRVCVWNSLWCSERQLWKCITGPIWAVEPHWKWSISFSTIDVTEAAEEWDSWWKWMRFAEVVGVQLPMVQADVCAKQADVEEEYFCSRSFVEVAKEGATFNINLQLCVTSGLSSRSAGQTTNEDPPTIETETECESQPRCETLTPSSKKSQGP